VEKAKIGLIQFHLSPPKADIENTVVISDYAQVHRAGRMMRCRCPAQQTHVAAAASPASTPAVLPHHLAPPHPLPPFPKPPTHHTHNMLMAFNRILSVCMENHTGSSLHPPPWHTHRSARM